MTENVIRPTRDLLGEHSFWHHQTEVLALFSAPGFIRNYSVPFNVPELVLVGNQFHVKPLFPAVAVATSYCLLLLSQCGVRLYQGNGHGLVPMTDIVLPGSPLSPSEHNAKRRSLPWHHSKASGRRFLPFHGANERDGRRKELLLSFFRNVDESLRTQLRPDHGPIVLAGVTYLCSLYRNVSRAGCVLEEEIRGNPDHISMDELHRRSWSIASAFFQSTRDKTADEYYQLWHFAKPGPADDGLLWWGPRLFDVAGGAQSQGAHFQAQYLMGHERYTRVDFKMPTEPWKLDDVSALKQLLHYGTQAAVDYYPKLRRTLLETPKPRYHPFPRG